MDNDKTLIWLKHCDTNNPKNAPTPILLCVTERMMLMRSVNISCDISFHLNQILYSNHSFILSREEDSVGCTIHRIQLREDTVFAIHSTKFLIGHLLPPYFLKKNNSYPYPVCYMVFVRDILITSASTHINAVRLRYFTKNLQKKQLFVPKIIWKWSFISDLQNMFYIECTGVKAENC